MAVPTWTVEDVCAGVRTAIEQTFPDEFWVRGELQGLRRSPAGHLYFDLIEPGASGRGDDARLGVVAFRGPLRGIEAVLRKVGGLALADGLEVRIRGSVDFYPPQGRVQFLMTAIDPRHTLGQLSAERDRILRALADEGLLDRNRGLPLPAVPLRIGLVTSHDSAAYNDFVHELEQTPYAFEVTFVDARVQGVEAEQSLLAALDVLARRELDVVAMVRGGGAKGDLLAFDRESVARAVATFAVPVFVGIGHEIDRAVVDEVAHTTLKTPTACAAAIVERTAGFARRLEQLAVATAQHGRRAIAERRRRLDSDAARLMRATTAKLALDEVVLAGHRRALEHGATRVVATADLRVDTVQRRVPATARRALADHQHAIGRAESLVRAVHPHRTLARGYSITRSQGRLVRTLDDADDGAALVTELIDGSLHSTVTDRSPDAPPAADPTEDGP